MTAPVGEDLPEKTNWKLLKITKTEALKYWIAEKDQQKFPFAKQEADSITCRNHVENPPVRWLMSCRCCLDH